MKQTYKLFLLMILAGAITVESNAGVGVARATVREWAEICTNWEQIGYSSYDECIDIAVSDLLNK